MENASINTTCGYCSTGCGLTVESTAGGPVKVNANPDYPVNRGKACPKGFQFLGHLDSSERALQPYLRAADGQLQPVDWNEALQVFTENFKRIQQQHGSESVAFLSTGQMTAEELAYLGALAKFGMGFVHGDGNTRQCMATAAVAYKQSFGFDAPPFTYQDFEESDVLVFFGANSAIAHPIMWGRVKKNARQPKVVIIDPRKTETTALAGAEHYALAPRSDLVLLYGLAQLMIDREWIDREYVEKHTSGFAGLKAHVRQFGLDRVSQATGLSAEQVVGLATTIHEGARVSFWWTMGVNQGYQAVRTAQGIINLALLTGNMGRPGTGANSITGQCNAMGSRMFSNTASLFCGRDFADPGDRGQVASLLNIDEGRVPSTRSLAYDQILAAVDSGQIKGLWIVCTNPGHSWPDQNELKRVLRKAEFVVVQDMFHTTETAKLAHLVLPAAGCGEKNGTFINSERRIGLVRKVADPPGQALPDLEIFQRIAEHWGCDDLLRQWTSPEAIFQIMKRLSAGTPCDISGIEGYAMLEESGGVQWPFPKGDAPTGQERRLFETGAFFHEDGRARLIFESVAEPPEKPDREYPFVLLTGRGSMVQWHTLTRTDRAPLLKRASPDPACVEVSLQDAETLGIASEDLVDVSSRRGTTRVKVRINEGIRPGQVFMSMHFPQTNKLTMASFDPYSRQPSFKYAAVAIKPAT